MPITGLIEVVCKIVFVVPGVKRPSHCLGHSTPSPKWAKVSNSNTDLVINLMSYVGIGNDPCMIFNLRCFSRVRSHEYVAVALKLHGWHNQARAQRNLGSLQLCYSCRIEKIAEGSSAWAITAPAIPTAFALCS